MRLEIGTFPVHDVAFGTAADGKGIPMTRG